jgi:hypothetical protein
MNVLVERLRNYIPGENQDEVADRIKEAADEIERLHRRVTVLEMVISEELDPYDCCDDANEMIVKEIRDRGYVRTPLVTSKDL